MGKEDIDDKLEKGYHSMLHAVEDLVGKEGKNIKDALHIAEGKISEWSELGREEIAEISKEIEKDLGSMGETIEAAKKGFREKWEVDAKYLSDATWDKLSSIADKTTLGLINFREEMEERIAEATEDLHEREHKDHQKWKSDYAMWLDDIALWKSEHEKVNEQIASIQLGLQLNQDKLDAHVQEINTNEYINDVHEKDISHAVKDPDNDVIQIITEHNEEAYENMKRRHAEQELAHAELKKHHWKTMVLLQKLHTHLSEDPDKE
ncbi:MAG: Unknown protein [uncultured Thiotrichaceae bacterium]|uniref:Uncharacterized protein n=1 Tax=uncultured Thiotrichaceae bacterium TaxID=298394 RepID=A0A6S6SVP0_9GAMM|nr:MAG: Unknown protein [uncultured Thiotrichaceae bacterium]